MRIHTLRTTTCDFDIPAQTNVVWSILCACTRDLPADMHALQTSSPCMPIYNTPEYNLCAKYACRTRTGHIYNIRSEPRLVVHAYTLRTGNTIKLLLEQQPFPEYNDLISTSCSVKRLRFQDFYSSCPNVVQTIYNIRYALLTLHLWIIHCCIQFSTFPELTSLLLLVLGVDDPSSDVEAPSPLPLLALPSTVVA